MKPNDKKEFLKFVSSIKFPDGYASNIARCLRHDIVQVLCKFEMIFPPAFFTSMMHVMVHLPEEALLAGPVNYRWMYPIERLLGELKKSMSDLIRRRRVVTTMQSSEPPTQPTSAATAPALMDHLAVGPAGSQAPTSSASSVAQPISAKRRHRPAITTDTTSTDASGSKPRRVSVPSRLIVLVTVLGLYCGTFSAKDDDHIVLYLFSGKYYVQAINYNNYTIRVVDANVDNCSSIPRDSSTGYNYHRQDPYSFEVRQLHKREISWSFSFQNSDQIELSKPIIFIACKTPVNSALYVETAPCTDAISSPSSALPHSQGHSFVMVGHVNAPYLRELCRVELMVRTPRPGTKGTNLSYMDIHNELVYGFELSWLQSYDRGRKGSICYVNNDTNKVFCAYDCSYGWSQPNHCASFVPLFATPPSLRGFRPLRQNPVFGSFPTSWLGAAMEEQCSLLDMRWRPSIFVWEVSCKSSRAFSLRVTDLGSGDFIFSTAFDWLPSFLLANICILCLQLEYTKKQGTGDLHFAAIFKLGYTKKQGTKHLDTTIIFEVLAIILLLHTCWYKCLTNFLIIAFL
ncbi:hypothetical protein L3X38_010523 [Prunus dulcis]|uniref:DUF4218 domain-containing protein n=1 Tax=Prunus dulcis TaxID=3755 RepID=A0AAD4WIE4_PRUDU|nr:hypothetical protein L3X38_010523 [Prunus dulcis]